MDDDVIISNQIQCLVCNDKPWSGYRHDYRECECGAVAADGGQTYLRRTALAGGPGYKDLSIVYKKSEVDALIEAVSWAIESGRNNFGIVCAIVKKMRDLNLLTKESAYD